MKISTIPHNSGLRESAAKADEEPLAGSVAFAKVGGAWLRLPGGFAKNGGTWLRPLWASAKVGGA